MATSLSRSRERKTGSKAVANHIVSKKSEQAIGVEVPRIQSRLHSGENGGHMVQLPVLSDVQERERPNMSSVQFRLPSSTNIESETTNSFRMIPETVIKDAIFTMLMRMKRGNRLMIKKSVSEIMQEIFPAPGVFDKKAYEKAFDHADRSIIYGSVRESEAPIRKAEQSKFKAHVEWAIRIIRVAERMGKSISRIFGSKTAKAKAIYKKAGDALQKMISTKAKMDASFNADYNLDDSEANMKGWAHFITQHMHIGGDIVKVKDQRDTLITIIHEASHLADKTVKDNGVYYPPKTDPNSFAAMDENTKITTAAFFEEFPRRWLARSVYQSNFTFIKKSPDLKAQARTIATKHFTSVRRRALYILMSLKHIRIDLLDGDRDSFKNNKSAIDTASEMLDLTIHKQTIEDKTVSQFDIILAEGVARATNYLILSIKDLKVPHMVDESEVADAADKLIDDAIIKNDRLFGNQEKDRRLIDYLEMENENPSFNVYSKFIKHSTPQTKNPL